MESKADFEGCTLKTMNALKKYAAPMFEAAVTLKNVYLPKIFWEVLMAEK